MVLQAIRSLIFYALFFAVTALLAVLGGLFILVTPYRVGWIVAHTWYATVLFLLRFVTGVRIHVTGQENLPEGGAIIAAKHQSDLDIFALLTVVRKPAFIAKKELLNIPFFGWAAKKLGTIPVDRQARGKSLPGLTQNVRRAIAEGFRVLIYPEGTRRLPLAEPAYKWGAARLYEDLGNVPLVPVALDTGLYWSRNSLVLWPGTAEIRILPPIPPGSDREAAHRALMAAIEPETTRLILEAEDKGIARPIDPRLRAALDAARQS